ncbi:MAG: ThiF family adenylyltransferase [Bacilli bacterium]|nr:ThiF family adenylyltransferase [Bacilli bacterium]
MFDRLERLIGKDKLDKLKKSNILIIGLGGVGGIACETLIRNGIETITIVDNDTVEESNKNRQIIALDSTINMNKTDAFENRLKDINKNVKITKITDFITKDNIDLLFKNKYDFVIDACDTVSTKILIIKKCIDINIPFISSMGMGKKLDLSKLRIMDIKDTCYDKIAKVIRKKLKEDNINSKVPVLSSTEKGVDTKDVIGSYSPLTNAAGLYLADYVIKEIIK